MSVELNENSMGGLPFPVNGSATVSSGTAFICRLWSICRTFVCRWPVRCWQKAGIPSQQSAMPAAWEAAAISEKSSAVIPDVPPRSIAADGRILLN